MVKDDKNTAIHVAYDDFLPFDPATPEKNLLRAVLLTAMSDVKKKGEAGRRAMEYLLSQEEDYLFSFVSVCNFLDVDPQKILVVTGLKQPEAKPYQNGKAEHEPKPETPPINTKIV